MSGGRLVVGVGVGALKHESDALGSDFSRRGAYGSESIAIMKALWTQEDPSFEGEFYSFSGVQVFAQTGAEPHPPVWVGGSSGPALRRVARLGDGWHPVGLSPDELAGPIDALKARLENAGRGLSEIALSVRLELGVREAGLTDGSGPMVGTADELVRSVESYRSRGVDEMVFSVSTADVERVRGVMEAFATQVMPRTRG